MTSPDKALDRFLLKADSIPAGEFNIHKVHSSTLNLLIEIVRIQARALEEIESGAVYMDGKPGATPKTRARQAIQEVEAIVSK